MSKVVVLLIVAVLILTGCGSNIEGTYVSGDDFLSITEGNFSIITKSDEIPRTGVYRIEGDKMILRDIAGWTETLQIEGRELVGSRTWRKQ